jgi:hypothetical protein
MICIVKEAYLWRGWQGASDCEFHGFYYVNRMLFIVDCLTNLESERDTQHIFEQLPYGQISSFFKLVIAH